MARYAFNARTAPAHRAGHSPAAVEKIRRLRGKHGAVLLFSHYPADPRPRRAAEALAAEGVTIDLMCLKEEKESLQEAFGNINVFRVPMKRHRAGRLSYIGQYSAFLLSCFAHLTWRTLTRRYDFVHVHNMPDVLVFAALIPKLLGAKVILDLHDPMPELMQTIFKLPEESSNVRLLKKLERWSIRFADLVLTVNLACKKIYSSRSCPPEKIQVILNSPDDEIFRFQAPETNGASGENGAEPFDILYHGSLVHRNGFDLAVDALAQVRERVPSACLNVCGERTNYFEAVMESARARGLDESIRYLGVRNLDGIVQAILVAISVSFRTTATFSPRSTPRRASSNTSRSANRSSPQRRRAFRIILANATCSFSISAMPMIWRAKSSLPTIIGMSWPRRFAAANLSRPYLEPRTRGAAARDQRTGLAALAAGDAAMIGVVARLEDQAAVAEFFELFKTPWAFFHDGLACEALICAGEEIPESGASLTVVYEAVGNASAEPKWLP